MKKWNWNLHFSPTHSPESSVWRSLDDTGGWSLSCSAQPQRDSKATLELSVFPAGVPYWLNWEESRNCQPAELDPALEMCPPHLQDCVRAGKERKKTSQGFICGHCYGTEKSTSTAPVSVCIYPPVKAALMQGGIDSPSLGPPVTCWVFLLSFALHISAQVIALSIDVLFPSEHVAAKGRG